MLLSANICKREEVSFSQNLTSKQVLDRISSNSFIDSFCKGLESEFKNKSYYGRLAKNKKPIKINNQSLPPILIGLLYLQL